MKKDFSYWLIRLVFVFVFIFSLGIFYQYWRLTKENPFTAAVNEIIKKPGFRGNVEQPVKNDLSQSDVQILSYYDVPTVLASGKMIEYLFIENSRINETELYAILSTSDGFLPVRIDAITLIYRPKVYLIIKELGEEDRDKAVKILEDAKSGPPEVDSSYIGLSSVGSLDQEKICRDTIPDAGRDSCTFRQGQKFYTREELLTQVKKYLTSDIRNITETADFSNFLHLEGNALVTLQANYSRDKNLPESQND